MAKVTNAFDTYTATADREDLSNIIYNISPMQTPFMSSIGKRNIKNVVFDWQTESLPTPSASGQLEGFELSRAAATATTRVSNVAMISSRDATVTGSQDASDPAGKRSEMAHQLAIMAKALKRDMEEALCKNGAKTTGNATTARVTGGFESWITSNDSRGTSGASTGGGAAPTDGTQRAFRLYLILQFIEGVDRVFMCVARSILEHHIIGEGWKPLNQFAHYICTTEVLIKHGARPARENKCRVGKLGGKCNSINRSFPRIV